jgi:hypothetical protein
MRQKFCVRFEKSKGGLRPEHRPNQPVVLT